MSSAHTLGGRGVGLFGLNLVALIVTWITTILRLYTRSRIVRSFGTDDWLMLATQILFTWESTDMIAMAFMGFGKHMGTVPLHQVVTGFMLALLAELSYIVCIFFLRLSVSFLYFRLTPLTWQRMVLWTLLFVNLVYSIGYFLLLLNQCQPVSYAWTQFLGAKGECLADKYIINASYAHNALSIASDWTLAILPIFLLRGTKLDVRTKILVACLLGVGCLASIASIIRITTIQNLAKTYDFIYTVTPVVLWSAVEPALGIIGANISTLRPFLRWMRGQSTGLNSTVSGPNSHMGGWSERRPASGYILNHEGPDKRSIADSGSLEHQSSYSPTHRPIELNDIGERGLGDNKSDVNLVVQSAYRERQGNNDSL